MPDQLFWNTVNPFLKAALTKMMNDGPFHQFRLVGGTSLSLQLGHRVSVDIDLFTDAPHGTVDFDSINNFLKRSFSSVSKPQTDLIGFGQSYTIGDNVEELFKLDVYYTEPFIQQELIVDRYRLATVEEIIAMKVDIVQRGARKKDFWDLHELLNRYSPTQMIGLHERRYPYDHDEARIRKNFVDFSNADDDFDPVCLKGKYWELIKFDFIQALV
jgi:hypothetical protein